MARGLNWSPAVLDITVTHGDMSERWTVDVERDGAPVTPSTVIAQVRRRRDRSSELLLDLAPTLDGSTVVFEPLLLDVPHGSWRWDLQVDDLTVLSGSFTVLRDISHEEVLP